MQVMLTFDYELFFGEHTGTVRKCMLEPTDRLLDLSEKFQVPMTFFVDVGFLMKLNQYRETYAELSEDYRLISDQLRRMQHLGCDIQLHIHPHWEKSHYDGNQWMVNTSGCYKLSDFPQAEIDRIIQSYYDFLVNLTGTKPKAFRAGGWCVQPFSLLKKTFLEKGIHVDSSVFPGGKFESAHYDFDFTSVARYTSSYRFDSDVCIQDTVGAFREVPIASWNFSPLFYWRLYGLGRLFPKRHKMIGDGLFVAQPGRKKSVLTNYTWNHVSSDGYYASMLSKQASYYRQKQVDVFVVIGHPKGMTLFSLEKLESFIVKGRNRDSFVNFETCSL